jgi:hypothetical protein
MRAVLPPRACIVVAAALLVATGAAVAAPAEGVARREQVYTLPPGAFTGAAAVRAAVGAGDAQRVHDTLAPLAQAYPFAREGTDAWPALAAWMRARGRADLADFWDARARAVGKAWINDDRRALAAVERLAPLALGGFWALPILGLVIGLGVGARRRGGGPPGPWVLPAASCLVLVFWGALLTGAIAGQLQVVGKHAGIPEALLQDRLTDPSVEAWVRARVRPPAKNTMLDRIRAETAAQASGLHAAPPTDSELRAALGPEDDLAARVWQGARRLHLTSLMDEGSLVARLAWPFDSLARGLVGFLTLAALGVLVGSRRPGAWRVAHLVVPGASRWLVAVGALALALALAAIWSLLQARLLAPIAMPDPRALFGLEGVALVAEPVGRPGWVWPVLAGVAVLHALGLWFDRRTANLGARP